MVGKIVIWINVLVFILYGPVYGMPADSRDTSPYVLQRITGEVKLDGMSDEAAWQGIRPFPAVMYIPDFGKEPTERTEIMMAYDDNYLMRRDDFTIQSRGKSNPFQRSVMILEPGMSGSLCLSIPLTIKKMHWDFSPTRQGCARMRLFLTMPRGIVPSISVGIPFGMWLPCAIIRAGLLRCAFLFPVFASRIRTGEW